jgi:hypothetical protein
MTRRVILWSTPHNSVTPRELTTHNMEVVNTTYTNNYGPYFRLVSKTDDEGNGFTFVYEQGAGARLLQRLIQRDAVVIMEMN